jgi:protein ImuB
MCLHTPYLSTDRVRRDARPLVENRPLVLTSASGANVRVERCCARARQQRIRPGMTLGQAQALAPPLAAAPYEPLRDAALLRELAEGAGRFGPNVEPVAPDTLLVDVGGCGRLFGGEENLARQALGWLLRQGFEARAAIADTVGAAWALATAGAEPLVVAREGASAAALLRLPPAALRLEPRVCAQLDLLGVRTVGDLLALPRASVAARFGAATLLRMQQATGEVFEGLTPQRTIAALAAEQAFETAVHDFEILTAVARRLVERVCGCVIERGLALRKVECLLAPGERARGLRRGEPLVLAVGLSRPVRVSAHVYALLHARLEQVDLTAGFAGVRVVATQTVPWTPVQVDLYGGGSPESDEALADLLDRIANRLGHGAILRPRLVEDYQPEFAYEYRCVAEVGLNGRDRGIEGPRDRGRVRDEGAEEVRGSGFGVQGGMLRPVRLLRRPMRIEVEEGEGGAPAAFVARGRRRVVAEACGPERIETGWWRGRDVQRDYFRVAAEDGAQYWIFRDRREDEWYLHGVFA